MKYFYTFSGRGNHHVEGTSKWLLEPDPGTIFLITKLCHGAEFIIGYCRSVIIDRWTCYTYGNFRRVWSPGMNDMWAEPLSDELLIYHAVEIHLTEELPWMTRWQDSE